MAKYLVFGVALLMAGAVMGSTLRVEQVESNPLVALVFPPASAPAPAYVESIGTPAPFTLPQADYKTWFVDDESADPLDAGTWQEIATFAAIARSDAGWAEACAAAGRSVASDRVTEPLLGALGCSEAASVTRLQRFALLLLDARAQTALWVRGAPGAAVANIQARQGKIRLQCAVDVVAREGGEDSPYAAACSLALETAYLDGDGLATFAALGAAYALVAEDIAARDPGIAAQPGLFSVERR